MSKTPTANHRRPLPFGSAYVAERCGQSSAKLSDYVFPQPLWKPFGEHLGEEEEEEKGEEKGGWRRRPFGSLLGHSKGSWGLLRASGDPLGGLLGPLGGPLGALWKPFGAEGSDFRFVIPSSGPSPARPGPRGPGEGYLVQSGARPSGRSGVLELGQTVTITLGRGLVNARYEYLLGVLLESVDSLESSGEDGDDDTGKRTGQARYEYLWASSWRVSTAWSLPRHQSDSSVDLGVILVRKSLQS